MNYTELLKQILPLLEKLDQLYAQRDEEIRSWHEYTHEDKKKAIEEATTNFTSRVIEKPFFREIDKMLTSLKFKYYYQGCRFDYITSSPYGRDLWYCNNTEESGTYNTSDAVIVRGVLFQMYARSFELKNLERAEMDSLIQLLIIKIGLRFKQTFTYPIEIVVNQYNINANMWRLVSEHLTTSKISALADEVKTCLFPYPYARDFREAITILEITGAPRTLTVETEPREQVIAAYSNEDIMEAITSLTGERKPTIHEINERLGNKISDTTLRERIVKSMKKGDLISMRSRKTKAEVVKDDEKSNRIDKKYDNLK